MLEAFNDAKAEHVPRMILYPSEQQRTRTYSPMSLTCKLPTATTLHVIEPPEGTSFVICKCKSTRHEPIGKIRVIKKP